VEIRYDGHKWVVTLDVDEELSLGMWTDLVKLRAGYKCQMCGLEQQDTTVSLIAHHIEPIREGGKNIMSNGMCVCSKCHSRCHRNGYGNHNLEEAKVSVYSILREKVEGMPVI
jgi:5-methylcytosine-specific restriction endonuclease McrA